MYLTIPSADGSVVYEPLFKLLDNLMVDRAHQVGEVDLLIVGDLAINWASNITPTDVSKIEVVYSANVPPPNYPWLKSTKSKWLNRHVLNKEVSYADGGKYYMVNLPYMKLARLRKLYQTAPISEEHFQYLTRIELSLEQKRQATLNA